MYLGILSRYAIMTTSKTSGWLYCLSNESMPGIYKIGMTRRTPEIRLKEANASDTFRPPHPYKIALAKEVEDVIRHEKEIHKLLEDQGKRINARREFFYETLEEINKLFNKIPGAEWAGKDKTPKIIRKSKTCKKENNTDVVLTNVVYDLKHERICVELTGEGSRVRKVVTRATDLNKYCVDGCYVRHFIYDNVKDDYLHRWKGTYCAAENVIKHDDKIYTSYAAFATAHYLEWRTA